MLVFKIAATAFVVSFLAHRFGVEGRKQFDGRGWYHMEGIGALGCVVFLTTAVLALIWALA